MTTKETKVIVSAEISKYERGMRNMQRTNAKTTQSMKKAWGGVHKALIGIAGAAGLGLVARSFLSVGTDYEKTMSKVKAITKATGQDFKDLDKLAKDLGGATEFTATQVGQLEIAYAKLGLTKNEILEVTELTLDLATALDAELSEAATVAAGTMNSFDAELKDLPRYMDVMAAGVTSTALDMEKFQGSMANVGAAANAYGWDIEQTTAKVGALVDANIDASKAGTDLRRIITELAATGMTYDEALDKIEHSTNKVKTAQELFGQRAFVSAIILQEQRDKVKDLTKEYYNATGSLKEMADTMRDNVITRWYEFKSAVERVAIDTFEQEAGILNETLKDMAQYVRENREELVKMADQGIGSVYDSLVKVKSLYDSIPSEVVGAAGYGIVGRIMFGGWGPAKVAGGIYLINEGLKQFNADIGTAVDNWKEWETAVNNITDVISGKRDWNTGAQIPQMYDMPETPATYTGKIESETSGGGFPKSENNISAMGGDITKADAKALEAANMEFQMASIARSEMEIFLESEKYQALKDMGQEHREWEMEALTESTEYKQAMMQTEHDTALEMIQWQTEQKARIEKRYLDQKLAWTKDNHKRTLQFTQGTFNTLMNLSQGHNKTIFEVSKAAATANAIVSTYAGAANAMRDVPYPFNFVAAASVLAYGFAQVAQIRSQSFDSGGGVPGGSGGATGGGTYTSPTVTTDASMYQPAESQEDKRGTLTINIQGDFIGDEGYIEMLAEKISEAVEDRDVTLIASNSKYADVIA